MHTPCWEPGTPYNYGDIVEYHGHRYKIIQPHTSQSDWAPGPTTEALWGRISDDDDNYGGGYQQQQGYQPQYQPPPQQPPQYDQHQQDHKSEEEKKHWYGEEENKKKLEIGGGLLVGAALLAGGMYAYKKHEDHKHEDHKVESHGDWVKQAKHRTEAYNKDGTDQPCMWVLTEGKHIPKGAILVGPEQSWNLYICRAFYEGGIQLGKASEAFKKGGVLGYKNKEIHVDEFEVLIGDIHRLHWVSVSGVLNVESLGYQPIQAGQEHDGTPLYIASAYHKDAVHPGKVSEKMDGAYIPYDGKEMHVSNYRVLCYNH